MGWNGKSPELEQDPELPIIFWLIQHFLGCEICEALLKVNNF